MGMSSGYSVEEADRGTESDFARARATGPDREQVFMEQSDDIGRWFIGFEEEQRVPNDVNSSGEIKLVHMSSCTVENGGVGCHQFTKVVQDKACEDFLGDELRSF